MTADNSPNSYIQAIIFTNTPKKKWNGGSTRRWLNNYNLIPLEKVEKKRIKGETAFRYVINPPEVFKKFLTKPTQDGIIYIIGFLEE